MRISTYYQLHRVDTGRACFGIESIRGTVIVSAPVARIKPGTKTADAINYIKKNTHRTIEIVKNIFTVSPDETGLFCIDGENYVTSEEAWDSFALHYGEGCMTYNSDGSFTVQTDSETPDNDDVIGWLSKAMGCKREDLKLLP